MIHPSPSSLGTTCETTTALVRSSTDGTLSLQRVHPPKLAPSQAAIKVKAIGLCRTDFYAISGKIPTKKGSLIPGHEFAGVVIAINASEQDRTLHVGDHVVVNPIIPCDQCTDCQSDNNHCCSKSLFMGVDLDGACCENIITPISACHIIPSTMPFAVAAFAEPVAATTAIFKANISPDQRGLLIGNSRITELALRVLRAHGFDQIQGVSLEEAKKLESDSFDYIIESELTTQVINQMVRLIRPRGKLILKSRQYLPVQLTAREIICKEPNIQMVNYGRFDDAVELLVQGKVQVDDLIGQKFPLQEFEAAFQHAQLADRQKTFLLPGDLR